MTQHTNTRLHPPLFLPCCLSSRPDVFKGLFNRKSWGAHPLPMIHCHCFALKNETEEQLLHRAQLSLGGPIDNPVVHIVRDVSPRKHMYCISFRLPEAVAFAGDVPEERERKSADVWSGPSLSTLSFPWRKRMVKRIGSWGF